MASSTSRPVFTHFFSDKSSMTSLTLPNIHLITNQKELDRAIKKLKIPFVNFPAEDTSAQVSEVVDEKGERHYLVVVNPMHNIDTPASTMKSLVHESVHIFQFMMRHIGESAPGWEIEAYTIAEISSHLWRLWANRKK